MFSQVGPLEGAASAGGRDARSLAVMHDNLGRDKVGSRRRSGGYHDKPTDDHQTDLLQQSDNPDPAHALRNTRGPGSDRRRPPAEPSRGRVGPVTRAGRDPRSKIEVRWTDVSLVVLASAPAARADGGNQRAGIVGPGRRRDRQARHSHRGRRRRCRRAGRASGPLQLRPCIDSYGRDLGPLTPPRPGSVAMAA